MPVEFQIDSERRLIIGKGYGYIDHNSLVHIVKQMVSHPQYDPSFNEIWDIREVTDFDTFFDQTEIRVERERFLRGLNDQNREAIVVSNELQYGIAKQYAILAEKIPLNVEVFYDYDKALQWIMGNLSNTTND